DIVLRGQLAPLALEHRIVGEVDARPDADRPDLAVRRDFWHRCGRVGPYLVGPSEVLEPERRVVDVRDDLARIEVVDLRRIESGLGDGEGVAQDFFRHHRWTRQNAG